MPTHAHTGLRRRGYTAEILNAFCNDIGVTRNENVIQVGWGTHVETDVDVLHG